MPIIAASRSCVVLTISASLLTPSIAFPVDCAVTLPPVSAIEFVFENCDCVSATECPDRPKILARATASKSAQSLANDLCKHGDCPPNSVCKAFPQNRAAVRYACQNQQPQGCRCEASYEEIYKCACDPPSSGTDVCAAQCSTASMGLPPFETTCAFTNAACLVDNYGCSSCTPAQASASLTGDFPLSFAELDPNGRSRVTIAHLDHVATAPFQLGGELITISRYSIVQQDLVWDSNDSSFSGSLTTLDESSVGAFREVFVVGGSFDPFTGNLDLNLSGTLYLVPPPASVPALRSYAVIVLLLALLATSSGLIMRRARREGRET